MLFKGYIFDYGGTLDTGGCHWGKQIWHAYQRVGVGVTEQQFREAYVYAERTLGRNPIIKPHYTFRRTLAAKLWLQLHWLGLAGETGRPLEAVELLSAVEACDLGGVGESLLADLYESTLAHTRHSREVLRQLKDRFPLVLVTNFYGNVSTVLSEMGFDGLFHHVVESAVVGVRKPDPRIFLLGVEALGLQPREVVVVGDSVDKDIVPAHQAGCQTVWLRGEQWADLPPGADSAADRIICNLNELI